MQSTDTLVSLSIKCDFATCLSARFSLRPAHASRAARLPPRAPSARVWAPPQHSTTAYLLCTITLSRVHLRDPQIWRTGGTHQARKLDIRCVRGPSDRTECAPRVFGLGSRPWTAPCVSLSVCVRGRVYVCSCVGVHAVRVCA